MLGKEIIALLNCMTHNHKKYIVWINAELHVVTLGGTHSYLRMCLIRISQSRLRTKIIKLATILTIFEILSLK